jgi:hypothetical protein
MRGEVAHVRSLPIDRNGSRKFENSSLEINEQQGNHRRSPMSARKPLGAPHVNTLRGRRGPSHAFAGMPSCGAPSGSHGSVHSNVYACSAGNDMPLTLYVRNA